MAYYSYKNVSYHLPEWVIQEQGEDYDGNPNYDGDLWNATSDYITYLESKIKEFSPDFDFSKRI